MKSVIDMLFIGGIMNVENMKRRLMWYGMMLFFLGLLTGFAETNFSNLRMGLAAHLEGLMNGIFLLVLGAIWGEIQLSSQLRAASFWLMLYGTYSNWLFTMLAAVFGTGVLSPVLAPGFKAAVWQEGLVQIGFISVGIAITAGTVIALWGLRRDAQEMN